MADSAWDIDTDGSTEIHPSKGTYLIEVVAGEDSKKNPDGTETPRRDGDGAPMIMLKCQIVMDNKGDTTWKKYPFNVIITKNDRGMRIARKMLKTFFPESSGKVSMTPKTFDGKLAWCELDRRNDFVNVNHESWQNRNEHKVSAGAVASASADTKPAPEDLPF